MKLFEHDSAFWMRYEDYEWKEAEDGHSYLIPAVKAEPKPYDPMAEGEQMVLDALAANSSISAME